jgi:hypothetical protein
MAANHINGPTEPFGYKRTDTGIEPLPEQLSALDKAIHYLESGCSLQSSRDWLVKRTGRPISVIGLRKIWHSRRAQQEKES